uniref:Phage protein n=1 Tax=Haemonchus contortus TaxID=6289 RepID=A0A7I5E6K5_HAECO
MVSMIQTITGEDDLLRWDKYWAMDTAGVCEYIGTIDAERSAINEVLSFFEKTIERRSDGYYVRLPYKQNHLPLPSNKTIALKRLTREGYLVAVAIQDEVYTP